MSGAGEKMFVFAAGGHGKVVLDIIERQGVYQVSFLVDDDPALKGSEFFGYPVIGGKEELLALPDAPRQALVAIGSNRARLAVSRWLRERGFVMVSAIHPSAQIGRGAGIGAGTVVMAGAVANSDARIGADVIVNTRASVDHDCVIGDGVHLAPGSTLCGTVTVGAGSFVCAGATIIPNLSVGSESIVAAGSVVTRDVPDAVLVGGIPARKIRKLEATHA